MVVVPTMLTSPTSVKGLLDSLEVHFLANVFPAHEVGLPPQVVERFALCLAQPVQNSGSVEGKRHGLSSIHATCRKPLPAVRPVLGPPVRSPTALRGLRRQRRESLGLGDGSYPPVKERGQTHADRNVPKSCDPQYAVALGE